MSDIQVTERNAVNRLEPGTWITSINGTSTSDKDETFLDRVKFSCQDNILILIIRKPVQQQECNLWDPNQVAISFKSRLMRLPFILDIFHPVSMIFIQIPVKL